MYNLFLALALLLLRLLLVFGLATVPQDGTAQSAISRAEVDVVARGRNEVLRRLTVRRGKGARGVNNQIVGIQQPVQAVWP